MKRIILLSLCFVCSFANAAGIEEFTKGMQKHSGFFTFYYQQDSGKVYLQVDKLKQPFIFLNSLPQGVGSNDIGLDRGQLGDTRLVQFERYGDKVFLNQLNTYYRANSNNLFEKQSVDEAFADSILHGFKVAASDNGSVIVEYTDFLLSDIHQIGNRLTRTKQGSYSIDKKRSAVYPDRSKAFPKNTELEAIVTFKGKKPGKFVRQVTPEAESLTVHLHHSLIELPEDGYKPRAFHPYSGYWSIEHKDYAASLDESMYRRYIPRHRLAKKDPAAAVSEAVEPIVYYLDPGAPEPVKSALIDGAMWWDQAFEAIGYKNAFQVKILPADADPMDVRYNVIQWVHRATRGWSYGASVVDPRNGEILKGHVTLGSLRVRQDYLIAQGLTSPFDKENADTSKIKAMALARIRQLSAHEVGHTLGIAHNFAASVNNRASVMDYPHPYITLKKGKVSLESAYSVDIGDWDKHAVAYGYQDVTGDENAFLVQQIKVTQDKGLKYISDPDARPKGGAHADAHLWDNGENPATELNRVAKVRAKALEQFGINSIRKGTAISQLEETLVPIYLFHRFQVEGAVKLIAGINYEYAVKGDDNSPAVTVVDGKSQRAAIKAMLSTLDTEFLSLPEELAQWLPPKAYGESRNRESFKHRTGLTFDAVSIAEASAQHTLSLMLNAQRLNRLQQQAASDRQLPSVTELFEQLLDSSIKASIPKGIAGQIQLRVNQLVLENTMKLLTEDKVNSEVKAILLQKVKQLQRWLKNKKGSHRNFLHQQISWYLESGQWIPQLKPLALPPGSPI